MRKIRRRHFWLKQHEFFRSATLSLPHRLLLSSLAPPLLPACLCVPGARPTTPALSAAGFVRVEGAARCCCGVFAGVVVVVVGGGSGRAFVASSSSGIGFVVLVVFLGVAAPTG